MCLSGIAIAEKNPPVIERILQDGKGTKVLKKFKSEVGFDGYVIQAQTGDAQIFYVTPNGKHAFLGLLFDSNLNNLTGEHVNSHMKILSSIEQKSRMLEASNIIDLIDSKSIQPWLSFGNEFGKTIYVFLDLSSPGSALFHLKMKEHLNNFNFKYFLTTVSFDGVVVNNTDESNLIAALYNIDNERRLKILDEIMLNGVSGKYPDISKYKKEDLKSLDDANNLFLELKNIYPHSSLPTIIYEGDNQNPVVVSERLVGPHLDEVLKLGDRHIKELNRSREKSNR